jgi:hypothetical protein
VGVRFPLVLLTPMKRTNGRFEIDADAGGTPKPYEITLSGTFTVDGNGNFSIDFPGGAPGIGLDPVMIGDSGVIVEAEDIQFCLSHSESLPLDRLPSGWRGIVIRRATVHLPGIPVLPDEVIFTDCDISAGGFSGESTVSWQGTDSPNVELFGLRFALLDVHLAFQQNAVIDSLIRATITLPFFDQPLGVDLAIGADGSFGVALSRVQPAGVTMRAGIAEFRKAEFLTISVESVGFEVKGDDFTAKVTGRIKPEFGDLDWPSFEVKELTIDSDGNAHLDGGWLDLRDQYHLDFHGFQMEITKLGFGKNDDGGKWIGFSGGLKLVDGLSAGASVEGLRIIWYDDDRAPRITLDGVGVEFEVPDVLRFKGSVAYRELEENGHTVHRFDGDIKVNLIALDLQVDGQLVIGHDDTANYNFFAIYLGVELPAGIPLFSTGLALYGMAGLFAIEMAPDKLVLPEHEEEEWYENADGSDGWYKRRDIGVASLDKWANQQGSLAFGAGVTIGTVYDNGFTFAGRVLLAIVLPGPILLIEGKANLLRERAKLDGADDPVFRALAVLDGRAGTFLIGLDAQYKYDADGRLIDIRGGAEAFFSLHDASLWHLYLGEKDPREQRIRADIFQLFEANAYFMLDANQLATGAWIGFDEQWKFGPLKVTFEAWLEGNAVISWKPAYFHGDLWLHGNIELSVFGFGVAVTADAKFAADVFDPFHVLAELSVGIELPWPLPDFDADITLEWGPEPAPPPLPLPLKEIAIEHFKVTTSWPLSRGDHLLIPNYDPDEDGFRNDPDRDPAAIDGEPPPDRDVTPIVPLDCRPHLTFGRSVHDAALIGVNGQPPHPEYERIGDPSNNEGPAKVRYELRGIALHRWDSAATRWVQTARKGSTGDPDDPNVQELYGSWAPVPASAGDEGVAQTKLWLWSKTPFDYTRHGGASWDEWFTNRNPEYPCVEPLADEEFCYDFADLDAQSVLMSPWGHPREAALVISWLAPSEQHLSAVDEPVAGHTHALCFPKAVLLPNGTMTANTITIELPQPCREVRIVVIDEYGLTHASAFNAQDDLVTSGTGGTKENPYLTLTGDSLTRVEINGSQHTCLFGLCFVVPPDPAEVTRREEIATHLRDELARWEHEGNILEPHTTYRLKIVTAIDPKDYEYDDAFNVERVQTEYAYFRTDGPPDDLTRYVRQTIPATIAAPGQNPSLPRPVYRTNDVGVEFNEDYVELMYRLDRRDLGLYLYDSNNRPVRDVRGRLIVLSNQWGRTEDLTLAESEGRWMTTINASDCATLSQQGVRRDDTLTSRTELQVLDPDTVYEARLVPLLLHEVFDVQPLGTSTAGPDGRLGRWIVRDEGDHDGPSRWEIREEGTPASRYIIQTTNIWGGADDRRDAVKPGTLLLLGNSDVLESDRAEDQPGNWTDYRFSVVLRIEAPENDGIGVVFRYLDENYYCRFTIDRQGRHRRLVSVVDGVHSVLAENDFVYDQNRDYLVTVEVIGPSVRVSQDGALVFERTIDALTQGGIGLYCWGNSRARFSDVRVDDFRTCAPIVYRFRFTTSQFADFYHHLHSFDDETWRALAADIAITSTVPLGDAYVPPSPEEARAFETLASSVLGSTVHQQPTRVEVTRVTQDGAIADNALAILVLSPEPIDWRRCGVELLRAERHLPPLALPGSVKLTEATFGSTTPAQESVTLLLRDTTDLSGYRVDYQCLPRPISETAADTLLLVDDFHGEERGLLFKEKFGPQALDHYTVLDEGTHLGPSVWLVSDRHIVQTSNIYGGSAARSVPDKPGTLALTGSTTWTNVRISVTVRSDDDDAIGVAFRYRDPDNYYRFSMDRQRNYRRLIKRVDGVVSVVWEDDLRYTAGHSYRLVVQAHNDRLVAYLDDTLLFSVRDQAIGAGCVGLYSWLNNAAHFESLQVESCDVDPVLWQPPLVEVREIEVEDGDQPVDGPSTWAVDAGALIQTSNIHGAADAPRYPGTSALGPSDWADMLISVRLRSDTDGAIGVVFRHRDARNYYRFSMDNANGYRRLVKVVDGVATSLWEDAGQYAQGESLDVTLAAVGHELKGNVDGETLFTVRDDAIARGRIGMYCRANAGARFERVVVTDPTRSVGTGIVRDRGTRDGPSEWRRSSGALVQTSNIRDAAPPGYEGTALVTGDPQWTDYRLSVTLRSDDDDAIGILVRYVDDENYFRFSLDAQRSYRRLIKKEPGGVTTLWEDAGGFAVGEPFTLTLDAIGPRLVGYHGSTRLFSVIDNALPAGCVGLYCWGNTGAYFQRVEVRRPPLDAYALLRDRFFDNDTSDWTFISEGTDGGPAIWAAVDGTLRQSSNVFTPPIDRATLDKRGTQAIAGDHAWTDVAVSVRVQSVLDDDAIGLLFRYNDENNYYRFSMDSQRRYRRLVKNIAGTFTPLWEDSTAYEVGRAYELTVIAQGTTLRGYVDGMAMFVVDDPDLATGCIGLYCWGHADARFSNVRVFPIDRVFDDWALEERFDVLVPDRWSFVAEGNRDGPMNWLVSDGELRQTSNLYGSTDNELDRPGTYALAGESAWTDYTLIVRLRSDDDDSIGVMFRYQDSDNYYRFSMDRQRRYRRLIRKVAGVSSLLWEDAVRYSLEHEYVVTVHCEHDRLSGYLDGVEIFTVIDDSLGAGRIGLYCYGNTGARFAEVLVGLKQWTTYYLFGREDRLPAGTRVRLHACREADAPPEEFGVTRRFVPVLDDRGRLRLPITGIDLRVVSPAAGIGHTRHILPDAAYTRIEDAQLLRRADGTGFFLVAGAGAPFGAAQHRLSMTFRRDNRAIAPDSQVLTRAGNGDEERGSIDIPGRSTP